MKQIFSGEVFEVLPTSNGIIFSYCKEVAEENIIAMVAPGVEPVAQGFVETEIAQEAAPVEE